MKRPIISPALAPYEDDIGEFHDNSKDRQYSCRLTLLRPACQGAGTWYVPSGNCWPYFLLNCGKPSDSLRWQNSQRVTSTESTFSPWLTHKSYWEDTRRNPPCRYRSRSGHSKRRPWGKPWYPAARSSCVPSRWPSSHFWWPLSPCEFGPQYGGGTVIPGTQCRRASFRKPLLGG